jgi:aminocarboxymuconate-semialdehyde decarboxylase
MIIDWHTHLHTPGQAAAPFWQGRCPMTIDNILTAQEEAGIDMTVVSNPMHELRQMEADEQLAEISELNRYIAEQQDRHSGRIVGFASSAPCGGDKFLRELERAVTEDGLKGVWVTSSLKGAYPDDDEAKPFFELVTRLDIPVVIHPPSIGFGEERMNVYRLASSVGRPFDNALAIARLIVRGIFEQFPTLKLVGSHLGGGICEIIGRLDYAYELQEEAFFLGSYEPMLINYAPSHYLKMMYLDLVCYHAPAARCGIETMGADHILFGTDAPPLTVLKQRGLKMVEELGLDAADKDKILSGNARKLLKLD